jgi:hypothetical protein
MAVLSFFHNSVNGDRVYEADDFAKHTSAIISDGVVQGLKVTYTSAYAYTIDTGKAIVMGRSVVNDAQIATAIGTPVNGDLYSVVVRMDLTARNASIETILGTTYQDDNAIKQIPLATILVGTNTLTITDKRTFAVFKSDKISLKDSRIYYTHTIGSEFVAMRFKEGSDTSGVGISLGTGGTTIIGGGESSHNILVSTLVPDAITERLMLVSDNEIEIMTGMQNVGTDVTVGKRARIASNGDINWGGNNVDGNIGALAYNTSTKTATIKHWNGTISTDDVTLSVNKVVQTGASQGAVLWTNAGQYMTAGQTATPTVSLDNCANGWQLIWSDYDAGVGSNNIQFSSTFIHKQQIAGNSLHLIPQFYGDDSVAGRFVVKELTNTRTVITGSANNDGLNDVCLRQVLSY